MFDTDENTTLELSIEELFKDPDESENDGVNTDEAPESSKVDTKAVSQRINEVRAKTQRETQEQVAKDLGYESYDEMLKAKEKRMLREAGLDEDEVSDVVDKLLEQRLADDPRLKKLKEYEERDKAIFVKKQLSEVNRLSGQTYTSVDQLPPEVLEVWQKTGDLKQAYLATKGEELLNRNNERFSNGSLEHLANGGGSGGGTKVRRLTDEEKNIWRSINPDITEEELNKKTTKI